MYGAAACFLNRQQPLPDQRRKRFLKCERAIWTRDRDLLVQVLKRVLASMLACAITNHEKLGCRNAASSGAREKNLRHHGRKRHGKLLPDRALPFSRERVANSADG